MEKELCMIKMEVLYMKVIILMITKKAMENGFIQMAIIILDNLKMI